MNKITKQIFGLLIAASVQLTSIQAAPAADSVTISDAQVQDAVQKIDQLAIKKVNEEHAVEGMAVAVVFKDKVIFAKGYGKREAGKDAPVDPDTVFQLASVSKAVSGTVVAALVGDGKITWDSKISDLDPGFKLHQAFVSEEVTIKDLYCHRSGLPEHAGDLLEDMGYDRAQVLHRLRYQRPDSSFRSHYAYTNFGLTEGAVAASKAYGMTWEQASAEKLFMPLGMNSTSAKFSDYIASSNRAPSHVLVDGKWVHKSDRQPDAQSPAGGVCSSANDLTKWMRMRLANGKFEGKQIVAAEPLAETEHPQMLVRFSPKDGLPNFYGLGLNVSYDEQGRLHLGHSGAFCMGNATSVSMVPGEQLGIIVLTNSYPIGFAESISAVFMGDALYGKQTIDWFPLLTKIFADPATLGLDKAFDYSKKPTPLSPALSNNTYLGSYSNDFFGDISIIDQGGHMAIVEGPGNMTFPLTHYTRDTFTYLPPGENSPGTSGITFNIGPDGKASSVTVDNLNELGQGTFRRVQK